MFKKFYLILPLLFCLGLIFVFQSPNLIKVGVVYGIIILISLLIGVFLLKNKFKKQWPFLAQLLVFILTGLGFFLFLLDFIWQLVFILIFGLVLGFFLFHLYQLFYQPRLCQPKALSRMTVWFNFIISYWFLTILGNVLVKFSLALWLGLSFVLTGLFYLWLFYYHLFSKFQKTPFWNELLIKGLIFGELYLVLRFLPLGLYLNALILSLVYLLINLAKKPDFLYNN